MSRILIVEDEVAIADLEKDYLELSGFEVEVENDGTSGLARALAEDFDLFILDLMLPGIDGFEICKRIREKKNTPILMVSAKKDDIDKIRGLGLGADDYVTKPFNPLELVARVKSQLRRYTTLSSNDAAGDKVYEAGGLLVNDDLKKVTVDGEEVKLTPIEYNILLLLLKNKGKVYSINEIYESIWNEEAIGADNTVAVHIRHIREKIEINPKEPRYLKVVWGVGYKIEDNK
jgi:DNA-binding response OmpR family regulator